MKKNVMILLMLLTSASIFAQHQRSDSSRNGMQRSERLKKELSLSDEQVAKMKTIRMKYQGQYFKIHQDTALTQGTARTEKKKLRAQQETELKGVLTPEQWTKYTALKARHAEQRKKHPRSRSERG